MTTFKHCFQLISKILHNAILPLLLLVLWFVVAKINVVERVFLPSPYEVAKELFSLVFQLKALDDLLATILRALASFLLAALIGIPIGLVIGFFKRAYSFSGFLLDFMRSIPATAIFPLFLLLFSVGDGAKIAMGTYSCVFVIIINTIYGVWSSSKTRVTMAQSFRASNIQILTKITFFDALPSIFSGLRNALSISLILIVVSEMFIGTSKGLGFAIYNAKIAYDSPKMYALIIILGIIGYLLNKLLIFIEKRFCIT